MADMMYKFFNKYYDCLTTIHELRNYSHSL